MIHQPWSGVATQPLMGLSSSWEDSAWLYLNM